MNEADGQCSWGRKIKAEYGARPSPLLPADWLRVFEEHWDCSPAILYYAPGVRPDHPDRTLRPWLSDATISLHVTGVTMRYLGNDLPPADLLRIMQVATSDHAWMLEYEREHGLHCNHAEED